MCWDRLWCLARVVISKFPAHRKKDAHVDKSKSSPDNSTQSKTSLSKLHIHCRKRWPWTTATALLYLFKEISVLWVYTKNTICSQHSQRSGSFEPQFSLSDLCGVTRENFYCLLLLQMNLFWFLLESCSESALIYVSKSFVGDRLGKTVARIQAICRQSVSPYSIPEWFIIFLRIWSTVSTCGCEYACSRRVKMGSSFRSRGRNEDQHRFFLSYFFCVCDISVALLLFMLAFKWTQSRR